ncbi:cell adhesion molecule Dscam2-like [Galleria mellonella]|uniref:Cell adhesion molecule Dscam2-like n=1 Tax=Galleria mellonella TaxID=7137 RepID=A0ABM3MFY1_GALME|nr:cell adhesion molecule Dscam2-like [Galleria mellonella]
MLAGVAVLLFVLSVSPASAQLLFLMEPPPRLSFSNSSGAKVSCAAHGSPLPTISWMTEDGVPVTDIPGLREALPNGTLWLGAFSAAQYRSDVHAAVYRCRAASTVGAILSRDMRLEAVMDAPWEVRVQSSHGVAGGAALLTCAVPATVRSHVTVTRWFKDGAVLAPMAAEAGGRYIVGGSRGDILVVRDAKPDDASTYSCEAQHALTGEKRKSSPAVVTVLHATGSMAPRMLTVSEDEMVPQGGDIRLVCCAVGNPPPTYSWFRHSNGRLSPVSNSIRISVSEQVLIIRRAQLSDSGVWTCRAHNQYGEQRRDARLRVRSRLVVNVQPQLQIANSGSSVTFNCSLEGGDARIRWLHDGVPVGGAERVLRVHSVMRVHRGMYQCFAERDLDSAQAAAELRLGDTAPELHYTFIEQALHPGPALALHCAASGSPPPRFTWLLDGQPVEEHNTPQRTVSQFMNSNGDVVSFLNISSVRPDDGGRYTCRAHNTRGAVDHSTRLNVYGTPSIRNIGPVRVVAGVNTTIYCPFSGFPISEIRWQRGGLDLSSTGGRALSGNNGELLLWPAEPADAGVYSCRVTAPSGQYAQKDVQIFVRNPPKIAGFTFPTDLVEGSSIQVLCGITSGDKPVYFSWLKDGQHIPSNLQVQEKSLDEFSFLIFSHVTSKHSGEYTCVASNSAAEVNHTASLAVKVAPSWVYEPQDVSALLGTQILTHCATKGYPEPRITWLKGQGTGVGDFRLVSNSDLQFSVLTNGTLSIAPAAHHHEGQYMCRAENGIGRGLSKIITVSVNEPAHFEFSSRNMTVQRTAAAALHCDARGDAPLQLHWTHNARRLDLATYRVSVSEKRSENGVSSQLNIAHAERRDSGVYRCRAENSYGRDELLIYLAVQEFPEAPRGLQVVQRSGRGATISWRRGYDGNARVHLYKLQYRVVGDRDRDHDRQGTDARDDWADAPTRDVPADRVTTREDAADLGSEITLEYNVEGLRPATAYALRLAAVNAIGESEYSDSVIIQTSEEAPSEPPQNVQVQATEPGELLIKWQPPPQESWNGELLGYVAWWREVGAEGAGAGGALTAGGWGAAAARAPGLRPRATYEVRVRAYNAVGAGPACAPLAAATLEAAPEAPPERVRCETISSQSIRVWWEPPPPAARGGVLLGYELLYEAWEESGEAEVVRSGGTEALLQALRPAANYSLAVRARTAAGVGPPAAAHCRTHEDVPGAPADIKALANSEDTVMVSWLAPVHKNGKIKHYTVYNRPQRTGQHSQVMVLHKDGEEEYQVEVRGLQTHQTYEFWVTAATASGEGEMSAIVARKPNARAPAMLASFARRVVSAEGARVRLQCRAAGAPPPLHAWSRRRAAPPLLADPRLLLDGNDLVILSVGEAVADNYTCTVRNPWGAERGTWQVLAARPPPAPRARLAAAAPAALRLAWDAPPAALLAALRGYTVEHKLADEEQATAWIATRLSSNARSHTLERLACGTPYRVRLIAHNAVGASPPSEELIVSTKGGPSRAPSEKDLIATNSTCARINLLTWDSNGCPLTQFTVSVRSFEETTWRSQTVPAVEPTVLCGLVTATWYHLKVVANSAAGFTTGNYYFSTLTEDGERIPAPAQFPPGGEGAAPRAAAVLAACACALLAALLLLAVLAYRTSLSAPCLRKGYEQGDISEEEDKSIEKRDNKRNCQQVYTSSPIKHPLSKKDQQEMYEISPYATFSMSGGVGGVCVGEEAQVSGGTLRTFGRGEPPPLAAAPPARLAHSTHAAHAAHAAPAHKQRSPLNSEEYTLSRAMTLMVRRSESDSDSSGSPCADCNSSSVSYRMPIAPSKGGAEEALRAATDSSAESAAAERRRRRPRRHHAPAAARYQQRQEQERRDFTIHV